MSIFAYLVVGHLLGDYLFQTNWMAMNKSKKWLPLLSHCLLYTLILIGFTRLSGSSLPLGAIALLFISHIILDKRNFVVWWVKHIMGVPDAESSWLTIVCDQIFHIIVLWVVVYFWF